MHTEQVAYILFFSNWGKSPSRGQSGRQKEAVNGYFADALLVVSLMRREVVRALVLMVGMMACSTALQAAPISLNLGAVGDPATLWDASANVNPSQFGTNTAVLGFNCSGSCFGSLCQTFTLATVSQFRLAFSFGFGEGACACDDPLQIRALVDSTEINRCLPDCIR